MMEKKCVGVIAEIGRQVSDVKIQDTRILFTNFWPSKGIREGREIQTIYIYINFKNVMT